MFMKLNKVKGSPDGITAEVLQDMPDNLMSKLCVFLEAHDDDPLRPLPVELRESEATLIPKRARPNLMKHLRPIAGLHAMKKAMGYRWLQEAARAFEFGSFQSGFIPGRQSGESTWAVRSVLELANEWGQEVVILHIDIEQAFDRLHQSSSLMALYANKASKELLKAT